MKELDLIQKYFEKYEFGMFVATSGGKDSTVILDLALKINPEIMIVHNPKHITHPDTVQFLYDISQKNVIHYVPSKMMEQFIKENQLKCQIDGTRISEFDRVDKSADLIINGKTVSRTEMSDHGVGIWGLENIYPIYDWSDDDVFSYCKNHFLPLSREYKEFKLDD